MTIQTFFSNPNNKKLSFSLAAALTGCQHLPMNEEKVNPNHQVHKKVDVVDCSSVNSWSTFEVPFEHHYDLGIKDTTNRTSFAGYIFRHLRGRKDYIHDEKSFHIVFDMFDSDGTTAHISINPNLTRNAHRFKDGNLMDFNLVSINEETFILQACFNTYKTSECGKRLGDKLQSHSAIQVRLGKFGRVYTFDGYSIFNDTNLPSLSEVNRTQESHTPSLKVSGGPNNRDYPPVVSDGSTYSITIPSGLIILRNTHLDNSDNSFTFEMSCTPSK